VGIIARSFKAAEYHHDEKGKLKEDFIVEAEENHVKVMRSLSRTIKESKITEDVVTALKAISKKDGVQSVKFSNGQTADIASEEATMLLAQLMRLKGDEKNRYQELLNKNAASFLLAYNQAKGG
jgi:hypothetical protein